MNVFMAIKSIRSETPELSSESTDFNHYPDLTTALDYLKEIKEEEQVSKAFFRVDGIEIVYDIKTNTIRGKVNYDDIKLAFAAPCVKPDDFDYSK